MAIDRGVVMLLFGNNTLQRSTITVAACLVFAVGACSDGADDSPATTAADAGTSAPDSVADGTTGSDSGGTQVSDSGSTAGSDGGSTAPSDGGSTTPSDAGSTTPSDGGSTTPSDAGSTTPSDGGSTTPTDTGTTPPPECKKDIDCDKVVSGLDFCQTAKCEKGVCVAANKAEKAACDDGDLCTKGDGCSNGTCKPGAPVTCDDKNPCTKDVCNAKDGKCANANLTLGTKCGGANVCKQGKCEAADSCTKGVCCDTNAGAKHPKGHKCSDAIKKYEYDCSKNTLRRRAVHFGCNGVQSDQCSEYAANYAYGDWKTFKACTTKQKCNATTQKCVTLAACQDDKNCPDAHVCKKGQCVKDAQKECTSGKCCFWTKGKFKPAGTKCSSLAKTAEWRCTGTTLEKRVAYKGCDGKSAACSKNEANYVFAAWATDKKCPSGQVCDSEPPGCSLPAVKCLPGACCDPLKGYKGAGTKCGTAAVKSEAQCFGADSKVRKIFPGCSGKTSACSVSKDDYFEGPWGSGTSCKDGCDKATGTCKPKSGCSQGVCCNKATKNFYPKRYKCANAKVKTEYQCKGSAQQSRVAYQGCNGIGGKCTTNSANYSWTSWVTSKMCLGGCDKATGKCIENQCTSGACCIALLKLFSPEKAACVGTAKKTRTKCQEGSNGSILTVESGTYLCDGKKKTCPSSMSLIKWTQTGVPVSCKYGCDSTKTKCKTPACPSGDGSVCCESDGTFSKKGEKCDTSFFPIKAEYQCVTKANKQYSKSRSVYLGCSGSSKACSSSSSNFAKGGWGSEKLCSFGCASNGQCKSKQCTSGTCCLPLAGVYLPKKSKCGSGLKGTYYVCKTLPVTNLVVSQEYKKYQGCSGASDKCSTASENYAHVSGTTAYCSMGCDNATGKCKPKQCSSGTCCTTSGAYLAKNSKCGGADSFAPVKGEFKCYKSTSGKYYQQQRHAYKGCKGTSGTCSSSSADYYWTSWGSSKHCVYGCDGDKCKATQCSSGDCCNPVYKTYWPSGFGCSSVVKDTRYVCDCYSHGCFSKKQVRHEACTGSSSKCGGAQTGWNNVSQTFCVKGCQSNGTCK